MNLKPPKKGDRPPNSGESKRRIFGRKLEKLEELEEERLDYDGRPGMIRYLNYFGRTVSASRIAPYC